MKKIEINGVEYTMKYSIRSLFVYEKITGHPYDGCKLVDLYTLMYAMLLCGNPNFDMEFDSLIDICDARPDIFKTFSDVMEEENRRQSALLPVSDSKKKA